MRLTMTADYAVRAIVYLAMKKKDSITPIREIAKVQEVPLSFLSKIMQTLSKTSMVRVYRGKFGGYSLAADPKKMSLKDVIEAIEGPIYLNKCLIQEGECDRDKLCAVHPIWEEAQRALFGVIDKYTIADMAKMQADKLTN